MHQEFNILLLLVEIFLLQPKEPRLFLLFGIQNPRFFFSQRMGACFNYVQTTIWVRFFQIRFITIAWWQFNCTATEFKRKMTLDISKPFVDKLDIRVYFISIVFKTIYLSASSDWCMCTKRVAFFLRFHITLIWKIFE